MNSNLPSAAEIAALLASRPEKVELSPEAILLAEELEGLVGMREHPQRIVTVLLERVEEMVRERRKPRPPRSLEDLCQEAQLSPRQTEVFLAVYAAQLPPEEAATQLGIKESTFAVHLHRARQRMRKFRFLSEEMELLREQVEENSPLQMLEELRSAVDATVDKAMILEGDAFEAFRHRTPTLSALATATDNLFDIALTSVRFGRTLEERRFDALVKETVARYWQEVEKVEPGAAEPHHRLIWLGHVEAEVKDCLPGAPWGYYIWDWEEEGLAKAIKRVGREQAAKRVRERHGRAMRRWGARLPLPKLPGDQEKKSSSGGVKCVSQGCEVL